MVHSVSVGASWPGYYSRCLRAWTPNVWRARGPYRCCAFERECISRALFAGGTQLFAHRAALRSLKPIFFEIRGDAFPPDRIAYIVLSSMAVYAHFFSGLVLLAHWISLS